MLLIRSTHPAAFRSGEWARVIDTEFLDPAPRDKRPVFIVEFLDGATDQWPVYDELARYEFAGGNS